MNVKPRRTEFHPRMLDARLHDSECWAEYERVYTQMLEQLAPATEGLVVNPGRKRHGWLFFGDDTGQSR